MQVDIDMSGRIEETNKPTAIALANGISSCLLISAREKRNAIEAIRLTLPDRDITTVHVRVFSIALFLLLREHLPKLQLVAIDPEYPGHEPTIKNIILSLCRKNKIRVFADQISFQRVGKKSPSHTLAYAVYKGTLKPSRRIMAEEILAEFGK